MDGFRRCENDGREDEGMGETECVTMKTIGALRPATEAAWAATPAARRGAAGEHLVREVLGAALDDSYTLIHNLFLPGGDGDVDAVVIGRRLVVLEIKTYAEGRPLRVTGLRWEYRDDDERWRLLDGAPSQQALASGRRVSYALRSAGLPAYGVTAAVVLVGGAPCLLDQPRVPVVRPHEAARLAREGGRSVAQSSWPVLATRALLTAAGAGAAGKE